MKFKVPHVLEMEDTGRPQTKGEYNPFGNGSSTWKIFYFFRKRKNSRVGLYSSYGRNEDEAKVALVRAIRSDWINSIYRNRPPGKSKITIDSNYITQFECVPVTRYISMCKVLGRKELRRDAMKEAGIAVTLKKRK